MTSIQIRFKFDIEIDSSFARAYSSMAVLYAMRYNLGGFSKIYLDSCHHLADKALSIDDQMDDAYVAKGVYYWATGQNIEALEDLNKAIRINPNSYNVYNWKGTIFTLFGAENSDIVKGIENLHKALNLVHGSLRLTPLLGLLYAYQSVGFFEEAENYNLEELKIKGDSSGYFSVLALLEFSKGNYEKAAMLSEKAMTDPMGYLRSLLFFGFAGQDQKAYNVAKSLADTMDFHPSWMLSQTKHDPLFESLRNKERFQRILQNMESKYQAEHDRVRKWLEKNNMLELKDKSLRWNQ